LGAGFRHFFFSPEKEPGRQCGKKTSLNLDQGVRNPGSSIKGVFAPGAPSRFFQKAAACFI
jgi:hypothetical protein